MNKKNLLISLVLSSILSSSYAGTMGIVEASPYPWFASIGTGYSWTLMPGIVNSQPDFWDYSAQGYDSSLGDRGFYTFAIGKQVWEYLDLSLSYINHEVFDYQKFQTGNTGTPGFSGNDRTRYFRLDNRALLLNAFVHPNHPVANIAMLDFSPFIGGGIGWAHNQVRNFYTVGNTLVDGVAVGSTSSIGQPANKNSFAWQGSLGINIRPQQSHLSVNLGYRYFSGGKFEGPSTVYTNSSGFFNVVPWSGDLKANQAFVEFVYTV